MAVQLSHIYYDYQLSCRITDHWSVYWYYCCRYHYFGGNYSRVHTNKSVWQPNIYLLDLFQLSLLLLSLELMLFTIICIINYSLVHTNIWWDNPISHHFPIRYNFLTNHFTRTTFELALSDQFAQCTGTRYSFDHKASHQNAFLTLCIVLGISKLFTLVTIPIWNIIQIPPPSAT